MLLIKQKSDILGTFASSLCLVHCIATPFLFLAQASAATFYSGPPVWWKSLDYVCLAISFLAIFWSTKNTKMDKTNALVKLVCTGGNNSK